MTFEIAEKKDIAQLTKLRIAFLKEDFEEMTDEIIPVLEKNITDFFEKHLNKDSFCFIAKDGEKIVATANLLIIEKPANPNFIFGRVGEVHSVYTLPEYRRKGIALQNIKNLVAFSKEKNLDRVDLKATKMGAPVYTKAGFNAVEESYLSMSYKF